ncbi:hypothetical protein F2Q69_00035160 [Brassica cretica]|uniref:Uncharacterized protein n=1 Tax=Brassica cretica TaxID=69181 RepID=A0A8S9SDI8_BRACR|nr:hypothetical protein F2Q69_00035160 [Brassica cretica]
MAKDVLFRFGLKGYKSDKKMREQQDRRAEEKRGGGYWWSELSWGRDEHGAFRLNPSELGRLCSFEDVNRVHRGCRVVVRLALVWHVLCLPAAIVRKTFVVGEGQDIKKELVVAGGIIFFFKRKNFNIRKKRSRTFRRVVNFLRGFVRGDSSGGNIAHNVAVRIGD